jgi:6-pyruvoyltetrahydropterin/6-carboxytetrahydropterin synthase
MEIYIDGNYSNIRFSAAHFIPGEWKCSRLHGHDYHISVKISGELNDESYFLDFSEVKSKLREIAEYLDHRVLIPDGNRSMDVRTVNGKVHVNMGKKEYLFPAEECRIIPVKDTTAECLSDYILKKFVESIDHRVKDVELEVHEGPGQYARARWTH